MGAVANKQTYRPNIQRAIPTRTLTGRVSRVKRATEDDVEINSSVDTSILFSLFVVKILKNKVFPFNLYYCDRVAVCEARRKSRIGGDGGGYGGYTDS